MASASIVACLQAIEAPEPAARCSSNSSSSRPAAMHPVGSRDQLTSWSILACRACEQAAQLCSAVIAHAARGSQQCADSQTQASGGTAHLSRPQRAASGSCRPGGEPQCRSSAQNRWYLWNRSVSCSACPGRAGPRHAGRHIRGVILVAAMHMHGRATGAAQLRWQAGCWAGARLPAAGQAGGQQRLVAGPGPALVQEGQQSSQHPAALSCILQHGHTSAAHTWCCWRGDPSPVRRHQQQGRTQVMRARASQARCAARCWRAPSRCTALSCCTGSWALPFCITARGRTLPGGVSTKGWGSGTRHRHCRSTCGPAC